MAGTLDASTLRRSMDLFAEALRQHREEIDSLNVFPVPDGDTGTNMLLTQEAVVSELASLDGRTDLRTLGDAISRASLMGARGNSGVILSQVLRGLCERLPDDGLVDPKELAGAIGHASHEADRAVAMPQDGTVLSVLRDAAGAAADAAGDGAGVPDVVEAVLERARRSLAKTREVLPELRRAGVVDAGGKGLVLLFDALRAALVGAALTEPVGPLGPVGISTESEAGAEPDQDFGFEVQYLLEAEQAAVGPLREALAGIGDSLVVVGGGGLYNVHVHTDSPDRAVALGGEAGRLRERSVVS
ncbi:MAG TPA: DAK2 domain-containing protein, partial [Actinomycetota bacterium]